MMRDKLQEFALVAEIVSAIAIIISLVFVGLQVRQSNVEAALNTNAIQSSVRQAMLAEDREWLFKVVENPSLNNRSSLTPEQEIQITALIITFLRTRESHWLQFQNGTLDEDAWLAYRAALPEVVFISEFGRNVWTDYSFTFTPSFVESINAYINELDIVDSEVMFKRTKLL